MLQAILLQFVHDSDTPQTVNRTPQGQTSKSDWQAEHVLSNSINNSCQQRIR